MTEENTALTTKPNGVIGVNMRELRDVAELIFASKVYGDIQTKEAAAIKVIAGMEYGFSPFQSMSMFDFIQGRPTLNAHGKATLINSSGDFRLKINELTPTNCSISVVRKSDNGEWKVINTSTFSWEDAKNAELTNGKNAHSWKKYPRNMLFARCVSNIWRWVTAELNVRQLGPIKEFEAEELQAESAGETNGNGTINAGQTIDGEIIDGEVVDTSTGEVIEPPDHTEPEITAEQPEDVDEPAEPIERSPESILADLLTDVKDKLNLMPARESQELLNGRKPAAMDLKQLQAFNAEIDKKLGTC